MTALIASKRPYENEGKQAQYTARVVSLGRAHCAIDFALSNCTLIAVEGGYVLIDTGPTISAADAIRAALAPWMAGGLKGIIYTHSHMDHVSGTPVFHQPGVPIWAQEQFGDEVRQQRMFNQAQFDRAARQFGLRLPPGTVTTCGIGPPLQLDDGPIPPLVPPTETFRDALDLTIGGVRLELRAAPGEAHDHLFVWLPDDRILVAGDNIYKGFPNLAALRGSSPRPVEGWIRSLDRMRALWAEHLVLGHTEPVSGADTIGDLLLAYRDAIAFVNASVVRLINEGLTPDGMVQEIRLPPHLRDHPYLAEVYGTVATSVRGLYAGYLGWFDGNATNLDPLPTADLAARLAPALGGRKAILRLIDEALAANDGRWAAWLADLVLAGRSHDREARTRKAQALHMLAAASGNPLARHWYLHEGVELIEAPRPAPPIPFDLRSIDPVSIEEILGQLPNRVRPDKAARVVMTVGYIFPDTGKRFTFLLRRGVGEFVPGLVGTPDLVFRATERDFKRAFVVRTLSPRSREFWQVIGIESADGRRLGFFTAARLLLRLDSCLVTPNTVSIRETSFEVKPCTDEGENNDIKVAETRGREVKTRGDSKKLRFYHVRNWLGMPLNVWLRLLGRNRFAVHPSRLFQVARMMVFAAGNSILALADALIYKRRVASAPAPPPPLFIIGHWRTGTTLLHELLIMDDQFGYPSTYQVMAPHHFLLTGRVMPWLLAHALPNRRPMDNMAVGFDKPQEDEFALCNLGLPSPYLRWAFPNRDSGCENYLDLEGLSDAELARWTRGLRWFLRRLHYRSGRRVVLKSPTHTARVKQLVEAFPGAQFIHIARDPRDVFPSTVHTWKQLWDSLGFQKPHFRGIEEFVLKTFERMYRSFERARPLLDDRHLVELRYEDLVRDPVGEVRKIYEQLGLEGFERARPKLEKYVAERKDYRTNRHELPEHLWTQISARWRGYIERYGYELGAGDTQRHTNPG